MKTKILKSILLIALTLFFSCKEKGQHLFILSGQSNMARLKPETSFTPRLIKEFGREKIIVVKDAKGGQPISRWYKNWKSPAGKIPEKTGDLYNKLLQKVQDSIKNQNIASITFIWMQGERDAKMKFASVYESSLLGLWQQLKSDLKKDDINFIIGRLSDFDLKNEKYAEWTTIRAIQEKVGNSNPKFAWINSDDLNTGADYNGKQVTDDLHLTKIGYAILGERFAEKAIEIIKK
tara:strand:+ start:3418 stop:4122 length:705 start_codon:yes stop_codon:yes gene_type:complete